MSEERKVDVSDLKPGMYVARLDRPWLESPFPFQGFTLENWEQVAEVRGACEYVYVEEGEPDTADSHEKSVIGAPLPRPRSRRRKEGPALRYKPPLEQHVAKEPASDWSQSLGLQTGVLPERPPVKKTLKEELRAARPLIKETHELVRQQVFDARHGRSLDMPAARESVARITDSIIENPDALLCLSALKKRDEYTYLHSLSVCILSVSFGRYLGLPEKTLLELGFGAFLHDIGKMQIPDSVLNKPGRLDAAEMEIMRKHPEFGIEIVDGAERIPDSSRNVIYSHHERLDGSGYIEGASGSQISPLTHIVSVCDTYDAIISHRPYKYANSPLDATAELYRTRGRFFDADLVYKFIGFIGVYPVGSLVELNTREVGVVVENTSDRLRPKLLILLDSAHERLEHPRHLDLMRTRKTGTGQRLDITRSLETGAFGLDPFELMRYVEEA